MKSPFAVRQVRVTSHQPQYRLLGFQPRQGRPDAVFVANDHMAFPVMDVLRFELGLDIPGDVSVIGFDDVPVAAWPTYDLTTIRQPTRRMSERTVETLIARIKNPTAAPERIEIDCHLVRRGSVRSV